MSRKITYLKDTHPELYQLLIVNKNKKLGINIELLTTASSKIVWWRCEKGHETDSRVAGRTINGRGCRTCRDIKFGSLKEKNPQVASYWHPEKNGDLLPEHVSPSSKKFFWWRCKNNHELYKSVKSFSKNFRCSKCRPELPEEYGDIYPKFDTIKNENISFVDMGLEASIEVWWLCESNHSFQAPLGIFNTKKLNCISCKDESTAISLMNYSSTLAKEWDYEKNLGFLPELLSYKSEKIVYWKCKNGHSWKKSIKNRTKYKTVCLDCSKTSFFDAFPKLLEDWDFGLNYGIEHKNVFTDSVDFFWWKCSKNHKQKLTIKNKLKNNTCTECTKEIIEAKKIEEAERSFLGTYPTIRKEYFRFWHPTKNGTLSPKEVTSHRRKFWWICEKNHEYKATVSEQNSYDFHSPCIKCSGIIKSIESEFPEIVKLWHPTKNVDLPKDINVNYYFLDIWLICSYNHTYMTDINTYRENSECPQCRNSLSRQFPDVNDLWHPNKNGNLKPINVPFDSNFAIWFQCKNNHEWIANNKNLENSIECIKCQEGNLFEDFPKIASEWNRKRNMPLILEKVSPLSIENVWWICKRNHEWQEKIKYRVNNLKSCKICKIVDGTNLANTFPDIASEWNFNKNNILKPNEFIPGSGEKVWWICQKGHEWPAVIRNRTDSNSGCHTCKRLARGSLKEKRPEVYAELNTTKNISYGIKAEELSVSTNKKVWWKCLNDKTHESWDASVVSRTRATVSTCPKCNITRSSKIQRAFHEAMIKYYKDMKCDITIEAKFRTKKFVEVDMISEKEKIAIEYDGEYYHSGECSKKGLAYHIKNDTDKSKALLEAGYLVVRIRENNLVHLDFEDENHYQVSHKFGSDINITIKEILSLINY